MQLISDRYRCRSSAITAIGVYCSVNMDDSDVPKDSCFSTKYDSAGSFARTSPAKFFAIVYHGEFLLTMEKPDVAETQTNGLEVLETREWLDSLDYVLAEGGPERAGRLLQQLSLHAKRAAGVNLPFTATTPYQNTIPVTQQPPFPGSQEMERRIKSLVR